MKLPLLLLVLAALLSWASLTLDNRRAAAPVVEAVRRGDAPAPAPEAPGPRVREAAPATPTAALFRPAAIPAALQEPQPGQTFALVGLAGGAEARVAFLRDEADGRTFRARAGDDVRGWTVERIDARCAGLRQGRRRQSACLS